MTDDHPKQITGPVGLMAAGVAAQHQETGKVCAKVYLALVDPESRATRFESLLSLEQAESFVEMLKVAIEDARELQEEHGGPVAELSGPFGRPEATTKGADEGEPQKQYEGPICRGSIALGTACGRCEKCADELKKWAGNRPSKHT